MSGATGINNGKIVKVKIDDLKFLPPGEGQRDYKPTWAKEIAQQLDLDLLGRPVVIDAGHGTYAVLDGRHRIEALKLEGYGDSVIECELSKAASTEEAAEAFLGRNHTRVLTAFERFRNGVTAGRDEESDINRIVQSNRLCVSFDNVEGAMTCVGVLTRVYRRGGGEVLGRALRITRDAFGDAGLNAVVIDGMGMLTHRYNGTLDEPHAVTRLRSMNGGVGGLISKAETLHKSTGQSKATCVAAAAVEQINRGNRGKGRLPDWWKS